MRGAIRNQLPLKIHMGDQLWSGIFAYAQGKAFPSLLGKPNITEELSFGLCGRWL